MPSNSVLACSKSILKSPIIITFSSGSSLRIPSHSFKKSLIRPDGGLYTTPIVIGESVFVMVMNKHSMLLLHREYFLIQLKINLLYTYSPIPLPLRFPGNFSLYSEV